MDYVGINLRQGLHLVLSGKARDAMGPGEESPTIRERYGRTRLGSLMMARRLIEAARSSSRELASVAQRRSGGRPRGYARGEFRPLRICIVRSWTAALSALLEDMDQRGMLKETLVVAVGEFADVPGWEWDVGQLQLSRRPRPLAVLLQRGRGGSGHRTGSQYGESDATASSPKESRSSGGLAGDGVFLAGIDGHGDPQSPESTPRIGERDTCPGLWS